MRILPRSSLGLTLLLLLVACAPVIDGSSVRNPLPIPPGQQVEVEQGSEVYLGRDYELKEFGLDRQGLSGSLWIPAGVDRESANVSTRFTLRNSQVPAHWRLELVEVRANRETKSGFGHEEASTSYRISPVLRLRVPAGARLGVTTVRAEIASRGGESQLLEVPVRVRAPAVN